MKKPHDWRFYLGIGSCCVLAVICLGIAIHTTRMVHHLSTHGERTAGVVAEIYVGAKGSKWAVIQFTDEEGHAVTLRDRFQMYLIRHHVGDPVAILYDPSDPGVATIDLGPWLWQAPLIFSGGFVLLTGVGVVLCRARSRE